MAFTSAPHERVSLRRDSTPLLERYVPSVRWLRSYSSTLLSGDLLAGLVVAVMLVPQSMAYAMLAGLPPNVGLYASIAPLAIYGLLGSSRVLSVGPVAIDSLLVAAALAPVAAAGSSDYVALALTLAFLVGFIELGMGLLRLGFIVNFISQPVLVGFTNAAAIVIGVSQFKNLLGISIPSTENFFEQLRLLATNLDQINWATTALSALSIALLLFFRGPLGPILKRWGLGDSLRLTITRSAPLVVVFLATTIVAVLGLDELYGVRIVGEVPAGLPPLTLPSLEWATIQPLMVPAFAIAAVGYMEAISTAKSLARKRRERIDSDQELIALGVANLGASFTGGYPVTGGLSRSAVNYSAGANTGVASIFTAAMIAVTVLFLTPLFYYLPNAVLASIIVVAVINLFDFETVRFVGRYSKADFASLALTFLSVLVFGVAQGIVVGAVISLVLYLWRTSTPHIAVVGRVGKSEHYRNVLRHDVETWPEVVLLRVDESLYFANAGTLADVIMGQIADHPQARSVVLIASAVNNIDVTALDMLMHIVEELRSEGVELHLADVKGPVMDKLERIGFVDLIGSDSIHLSVHEALKSLGIISEADATMQPVANGAASEHPESV